ncbi:MAG: hypothetical protein HYZ53_23030 [Planctomycetes bacterium]|nr:hypothetical protein [Planctomycetota bacterium]
MSTPRRPLACLLFLALLAARLAPAKDEPAVELRWKTKPQDSLDYAVSTVSEANGQVTLVPQPSRSVGLFGYEVDARGNYLPEVAQYTEIALPYLFAVPQAKVKPDSTWKVRRDYPSMPGLNPFAAQGEGRFVGYEDVGGVQAAVLRTRVDFAPLREPGRALPAVESNRTITEGHIAITQHFDVERGLLLRARYEVLLPQAYDPRYKERLKKESKVDLQDYRYQVHEQWDLKAVQDLAAVELGVPVREAIDKGVTYLRGKQEADGGWDDNYKKSYLGGPTALVLLALLKAGVSPKDPAVVKGFEYLKGQALSKTYVLGLTLMALEAKYISTDEVQNAEAFLDGKKSELALPKRNVSKEDLKWMADCLDWLSKAMSKDGAWSYEGSTGGYDHSNAQYGVLGLLSAARCGLLVKPETWATILKHWLSTQESQGPPVKLLLRGHKDKDAREVLVSARGWGYTDVSRSTAAAKTPTSVEPTRGSMTCAGIASVCLARAQLAALRSLSPENAQLAARSVLDGVAWLKEHFSVRETGATAGWYYYYMYGLERALVLAQQRHVGEHDWYREGAVVLLARQAADGAWSSSSVETCFAILFLKRATTPIFSK